MSRTEGDGIAPVESVLYRPTVVSRRIRQGLAAATIAAAETIDDFYENDRYMIQSFVRAGNVAAIDALCVDLQDQGEVILPYLIQAATRALVDDGAISDGTYDDDDEN